MFIIYQQTNEWMNKQTISKWKTYTGLCALKKNTLIGAHVKKVGVGNCSHKHVNTGASNRNLILVGHLASAPNNQTKETEGIVTCKVTELRQSIQNDTNQRQVEGSNFDLHLRFDTTRVQVVRTEQAVDGTDSFPLHFADPIGTTQKAKG